MLTCQHRRASPAPLASLVHPAQACKEIFPVHTRLLGLAELIGKDVQHQLTIAISVDVAVGLKIQVSFQLGSIDEVSVMGQANTVGAVHIKGLSLGIRAASSSWVSQMSNAHEAWKVRHSRTIIENLGCHTIGLQLVNATTCRARCNTRSILASI